MKKTLTAIEIIFICLFTYYCFGTNNKQTDRIYFLLLELSAISGYHLYEKFKSKL
jgi:hypothetical protein